MTLHLNDIERQIAQLQLQAETLRTTQEDAALQPVVWRKRQRNENWWRYVELPIERVEAYRADGWEPLYRRQTPMTEAKARLLAREHRGVDLVRETEAAQGITP